MSAKQSYRGNALSEYAFVGAIVLGIGVLAFMALGGSISNLFGNTNQAAQVDIVPGLLSSAGGPQSSRPVTQGNPVNSQGIGPIKVHLADGTNLTLDYPLDPGKSVQTAGGNGTTEILANTLTALGQQLLDQGKITEDQFYWFQRLANSGHGMGVLEKNVETRLQKPKSTMSYDEYWQMMHESQILKNSNLLDDDYQLLKDSGALNDPSVAAVVDNLVNNIQAIGTATRDAVDAIHPQDPNAHYDQATNTYTLETTGFKQKLAEETHANSAGICNVGGGKDTGVYCP